VAITFDDGPRGDATLRIVEILATFHARATFFVEGHRVRKHPTIVSAILTAGHEIGNHGYEHGTGTGLPEQIRRGAQALEEQGVRTRLFRPPLGKLTVGGLLYAVAHGYRTVLWSFDGHDSMRHEGKWTGAPPDYSTVVPGDIVLLHDDNPLCLEELPQLLAIIRAKKLRAVTVSELLGWSR